MKVLLSGMVAGCPGQGGAVWAVLQYLLGLKELGHDVFFLEPIPPSSLLPAGSDLASSRNAEYFRQICRRFGLEEKAALMEAGSQTTFGADYSELERTAAQSDLLLNLSGLLRDQNLTSRIGRRVYLDLDPGFTQLWQEAQGVDMGFADHNRFVTVGLRIGQPDCPVPTCGLQWIPTPQPLVVSHWPFLPPADNGAYSTIGNWRGYGSIHWRGRHFGQKAHSFRRFLSLPSRVSVEMNMALAIDSGEGSDLRALADHGWTLTDPSRVSASPDDYQEFIRGSRAELGIAKSGYVEANSGWFSDRSVCYLATGRPVLAQETGFTGLFPTGEGLLRFRGLDEIVEGVESIESNYPLHSRRAVEIAHECFDSRKTLTRLLERLQNTHDPEPSH